MKYLVNVVMTATLVSAAVGCDDSFDTNRTVEAYGSFGDIMYREACQRVAYTGELAQQAAGQISTVDVSGTLGKQVCIQGQPAPATSPEKLQEIQVEKQPLSATVDAILPKPFLSDLQDFLVAITVLADDGTMPNAISSMSDLLGTMHDDPDFAPALARLATRLGYRPTKTAAGLVHTVVEYPNIDDFLGKLLALIAPGGSAETEFKAVLDAASHELRTAQPVANPKDPERTLKLALDLMLMSHPAMVTGTPRPLVARDYRGLAAAPTVGGAVQAPFVDLDGDGLADVNANGQYVDATGNVLSVPSPFPELGAAPDATPRDDQGRALATAGGSPLYSFLDLDGTVISGLTHESSSLMDPNKDITLGLVYGLTALLGPRSTQTKMYMDPAGGLMDTLTYNGYDTTQSAALDLIHAFIQLLGDPNADQTFQSAQTLLTQHESETARLIGAMLDASDRGKQHPEAQIPPSSDLYDDLAPIIVRILRVPGLAEDIAASLKDPRSKGFAPMVARLMNSNDQLDFNHDNGPNYPLIGNLDNPTPVNRSLHDVDYNRSLMQRIAHLIHDSNGTQFCNKDGATPSLLGITLETDAKCQLFEIDDLALFYVLNMASASARNANPSAAAGADFCGHLTTGNVLITGGCTTLIGTLVGINGFGQYPTPAALNRSLFLRNSEKSSFMQDTTDDILCSDGDKFIDVHDKSIFAWETTLPGNPSGRPNDTFYDAVQPIVDAFARHDECVSYDSNNNCTQVQNAAKIFVDLFAMLHEHWTSPNGSYFGHKYQPNPALPRYAAPDNIVSYEPLMNEVLTQADLIPALINFAPTLTSFTVDGTAGGQPALPVLIGTASYLFDPAAAAAAGVSYRNGAVNTVMSDGVTPVAQTTPYLMLADAYAHKRNALAAVQGQAGAWKNATSAMVDQMLTVETTSSGGWQLKNRNFYGITIRLIDFVRARLQSHNTAGDTGLWVHQTLTQDLTDTLGGPTFAALGDFVTKVEADTDARTRLYSLLQYLVNQANDDLVFQTALTSLADQVQMFLDDPDLIPIARMLGVAMDPTKGTVDAQLTMIKKARDLDTKHAFLTILRNLYQQDSTTGEYPASNLADILSQLNRAHPLQTGPMDAGDYKSLLGEVQSFLSDEKRGFGRFLAIVQTRGPTN